VPTPRQRNSREENAQIKGGETPEDWREAKRSQKDVEARWTKKHGKSHYGYKNHISIDNKHKVIRRYGVTAAAVHDRQVFEALLDENNCLEILNYKCFTTLNPANPRLRSDR